MIYIQNINRVNNKLLFFFHFFYRERDPDRVNNENHSKETEPKDFQMHKLNRAKQRKCFSRISLKLKKELSQIRSSSIFCAFFFNIVKRQNLYRSSFFFTYSNVGNEQKQYISKSHLVKIIKSQLIISYSFWRSYLTGIIQHARHLFFLEVT